MARLTRLVLPGQSHCLIQRGLPGRVLFPEPEDRDAYLQTLAAAARAERVVLHAWALRDTDVRLLATPASADGLGRMVQAVGRRYVSAYNRRHGRSGTLWSGRFSCAVVEPGAWRLAALQWVESRRDGATVTSAAHRTGGLREPAWVDLPEYWALGNTPFEREAAYRLLLDSGLPAETAARLQHAAGGGWAVGSAAYTAHVAQVASRPSEPRSSGRPRKPAE